MRVVLNAHLRHMTTLEATNLLRRALLKTMRSNEPSAFSAVRVHIVDVVGSWLSRRPRMDFSKHLQN
jgi:hypothetical protein